MQVVENIWWWEWALAKGRKKLASDDKAQQEAKIAAEAEAEAQRVSKATQRAETVLAGLFEWVGKTDSRTAFLFAVNTALGGVALGALTASKWSVFEVLVYVSYFVMFSIVSYHLIMVQYPNVTSPNRSMLFFGTIAGHTFDDFVNKFSSMDDDEYLRDVLHQCYVNAMIVQKKFLRLQRATNLMIISSFVWVLAIAVPALGTPAANSFFASIFQPSAASTPLAPVAAVGSPSSPIAGP